MIKKLNFERMKRQRWEKSVSLDLSKLFQMLNKCGSVEQAHLEIMRKQDFWQIFPVEGKFRMAAVYSEVRKKARALVGWKLLFLEHL